MSKDHDSNKYVIPPGTYTIDTLPPLSPEAQALLDSIKARRDSLTIEERARTLRDDVCIGLSLADEHLI